MTATEFLQEYTKAKLRLIELNMQLQRVRAKMEGCNPGLVTFSTSRNTYLSDKLQQEFEQYQDLELSLKDKRAACRRTMRQVRLAISNVPDPRLRSLLEYRYIFDRDWKWIAEQLHSNPSTARGRLHYQALNAFEKIIIDMKHRMC